MKVVVARVSMLLITVFLASGCALTHDIAEDYPAYVAKTKSDVTLPKSTLRVDYELSHKASGFTIDIESATVGSANTWTVQFGPMLTATLQSPNVQAAFASLAAKAASNATDVSVVFELVDYRFENYRAYVGLEVTAYTKSRQLLYKNYKAEGPSQGGKMWIGGAMAMRTAVQHSTRTAIEDVLKQFLTDLNATKQ